LDEEAACYSISPGQHVERTRRTAYFISQPRARRYPRRRRRETRLARGLDAECATYLAPRSYEHCPATSQASFRSIDFARGTTKRRPLPGGHFGSALERGVQAALEAEAERPSRADIVEAEPIGPVIPVARVRIGVITVVVRRWRIPVAIGPIGVIARIGIVVVIALARAVTPSHRSDNGLVRRGGHVRCGC
jgi:hypothetical protein